MTQASLLQQDCLSHLLELFLLPAEKPQKSKLQMLPCIFGIHESPK